MYSPLDTCYVTLHSPIDLLQQSIASGSRPEHSPEHQALRNHVDLRRSSLLRPIHARFPPRHRCAGTASRRHTKAKAAPPFTQPRLRVFPTWFHISARHHLIEGPACSRPLMRSSENSISGVRRQPLLCTPIPFDRLRRSPESVFIECFVVEPIFELKEHILLESEMRFSSNVVHDRASASKRGVMC
jgi:hypothetical protein